MVKSIAVQKQQVGTCPHGAPLGACPICSGMGGGGGSRDVRRKPGEMTWNECYAQGLRLKQTELNKARAAEEAQNQLALRNNALAAAASRFASFVGAAVSNVVSKTLAVVNKTLIQPALNAIKTMVDVIKENIRNLTQQVKQALQDIKQKIIDIADKLAAIFGEMKNAVEKNISDRFKRLTKKALSIFGILEFIDSEFAAEDEDERIDEDKRVFELTQVKENQRKNERNRQ